MKRKLALLLCTAVLATPVAGLAADNNAAPAKKESTKQKKEKAPSEIMVPSFNDNTYAKMNQIQQEIALTAKMNELEQTRLAGLSLRVEQQKVQKELQTALMPIIPEGSKEKELQAALQKQQQEAAARKANESLFPMPGGNPVVRSAYVSDGHWEAELITGKDIKTIVRVGDKLPGGYNVKAVGFSGVMLEKNGRTEILPR